VSCSQSKLKHVAGRGEYGLNFPASEYVADGVRLIRTTDLANGYLSSGDSGVYVPQDAVAAQDKLACGDILLSRSGTIGRAFLVPEEASGMAWAGFLVRYVPRTDMDGRFLYYYAQSADFQNDVHADAVTSTIQNFNADRYDNMMVPHPSLDEQRAIADYLDQETAQIEALAAKQEEFKAKLTERRIALISSAVIRGLDPETPIKTSGADWFEAVPSHWRVERLKNSILDAQTGAWGNDPVGDGSDVLCVRVADFDRPLLRVGNAKTMRAVNSKDARPRLLQQGDLLLEKSGGTPLNPVGFVAMYEDAKGPAVTSNFITRLRLKDDQDPRYWLYAHATSYGTRLTARSVKQTTGIQNLDQASYFNELFPYPPLEEQRDIAAYLDKETSRIDTLIAKAEEHIALAKERRAALITAAVTGQFDVRTAGKAG